MALGLDDKKLVVEEVAAIAADAHSAIAAEYRGLTVGELTELRRVARESGVYLRVVKNTLAQRAVEGTEFECMKEGMTGPLIFAFSMEDPGSAPRVINDFAKEHDKLVTKLVSIGGQLYDASELKRLAMLPTRDQAISMLMALMKAPVEKFVRTLAEPHAKLTRTVAAIKDQKEAA
ncbi:MAG: 50S ribosomal protein L10 [Methylococcales bacterium]|nr:50S ribosomal protein L10 [Methylococcales bacterium]MDG2365468.1 50S ribosomal protein L10 [Methylococcaceae bacterium]MBT3507420.1 50S ribosomal protein L10 [Methylococcales bacterium]MBT3699704.1 50S ribosomal protein L10 [Methylococcales bacterium]MBT3815288.1 50S ribosomal protein L10 [Methylococcales bacterium]